MGKKLKIFSLLAAFVFVLIFAACDTVAETPSPSPTPTLPPYAVSATLAYEDRSVEIDPDAFLEAERTEVEVTQTELANALEFDIFIEYSDERATTHKLFADPHAPALWEKKGDIYYLLGNSQNAVYVKTLMQTELFTRLYTEEAHSITARFLSHEFPLVSSWIETPVGAFSMDADVIAPEAFRIEKISDLIPEFSVEPKEWSVILFDREGAIMDYEPDPGFYSGRIHASFERENWKGELTFLFEVEIAGTAKLSLAIPGAAQGEVIPVTVVDAVEYAEYHIHYSHVNRTSPCAVTAENPTVFLPLNITAPVGTFTVTLYRNFIGGDMIEELDSAEYIVTTTDFVRQDLETSSSTQAIYTNGNLQNDNEKQAAARAVTNPTPYFDSVFQSPLPIEPRLTTDFGQSRYVNGNLQSRHTGLDLAVAADTDILAPQRGRITFAGELIVNGNTVIIDHGMGVFSSYSHMNSISVEVGDMVETGAVLGLVGSTGYSTGPHLHYTMLINDYYVHPNVMSDPDVVSAILGIER